MDNVRKARVATLLMFLICGISVSSWVPMVPIVKQHIGVDEKQLGLLLLAMGGGAIITMPFIGRIIHHHGSKHVIIISSIIAALTLPVLTIVPTPFTLGIGLFIFGASMGSLDVSMNSQAVVVEHEMKKPAMSSFHGMFSVGGLIGAIAYGSLLGLTSLPFISACIISAILLIIVATNYKNFLNHQDKEEKKSAPFTFPKGAVMLLGIFCFFAFLMEGSLLDWSALFLRERRYFSLSSAGTGYAVFSIAMATMRFTGDKLVHTFSSNKIVSWGAFIAAAGMVLTVTAQYDILTMLGFLLMGIGAANIVPVIFGSAGKADPGSPELALASVTTMGYAGQLAGPALIGFAADTFSLPIALGVLAIPLTFIAIGFAKRKNT
jgi:predicted MFS family arabinose efflux permease